MDDRGRRAKRLAQFIVHPWTLLALLLCIQLLGLGWRHTRRSARQASGQALAQEPPSAATRPVATTKPAVGSPDYFDVAEAVFRYQIGRDAGRRKHPADHLFLALAQRDPPPPFLARFAGGQPDVSPRSAAKILRPGGGVTHGRLGGNGVIFNVDHIEWQDADTAFVGGGYYIGNVGAAGYMHLVQRHAGHWVVTGAWMRWIS